MTAKVKVAGTWRSVSNAKVRVGGTWRSVSSGFVKVGGTWRKWLGTLITDTFTRADSATSLGTTETESKTWQTLRGTAWGIASNKASNSGAASGYPIAYVTTDSADSTTSVEVSEGCGPVVWITDANNWWASVYYTTTSQVCGGGATAWVTSPPSCSCGVQQSQSVGDCNGAATGYIYTSEPTCACGTAQSTIVNNCYGGYTSGTCAGAGGTWNGSQCCFDEAMWRCSATASSHTEYRCSDSVAGSSTTHRFKFLRNQAGTILTAGDQVVSGIIRAIKMVTAGNDIAAYAYSDTAMTTQLGSFTSSDIDTHGVGVGIVKSPTAAQGSTVDSFSSGM